jgi:hypothetical protein
MAASEILGLFTTPEQYQQNQLAQFQNRAAREVQLNPFEQAALGARTAGYQLGQGIGSAFGGQDPQLQLIARRQQLASQLNPNDPDSYMRVAKIAADAGDQQFAIAISDAGRKAMSEYALIQQRTRERQGADPFQQIIRSGKYTPASLATYQTTQNVGDLVLLEKEATSPAKIQEAERVARSKGFRVGTPEFEAEVATYLQRPEKPEPRPSVGGDREAVSLDVFDKNYYDLTPAQRNEVNKKVDAKKLAEAKATSTPAAAQAKQVSKNKTDLAAQVETDAFGASDRLTLARNLKTLLPTAFTGIDSNLKLQASRVAEVFGINIQGVPDSQIIDTILGEMTIGSATNLKGGLSDKDVKFLKETIGTRGLSLKTLQFVANKIEEDALIDSQLNDVVQKYVADEKNLNQFNFASERKNVTEKIRKDKQRLDELRNKAKTQ